MQTRINPLAGAPAPASMLQLGKARGREGVSAIALSDDEMLDRLQHAAFDYFLHSANPDNGLIADTTRDGSPSSIAVVGFALSAYVVGVERGWIERADAVQHCLKALRFFWRSDQSGNPDATG